MRTKVTFFYSDQQILRPEEVNLDNMTLCYQPPVCCINPLPLTKLSSDVSISMFTMLR